MVFSNKKSDPFGLLFCYSRLAVRRTLRRSSALRKRRFSVRVMGTTEGTPRGVPSVSTATKVK